jgi:hypothetical protein
MTFVIPGVVVLWHLSYESRRSSGEKFRTEWNVSMGRLLEMTTARF